MEWNIDIDFLIAQSIKNFIVNKAENILEKIPSNSNLKKK